MIAFETDVRIERPIDEVFAFVSDPLEFPRWNSAVHAVRKSPTGSTYVMERELPTGHAVNELEIVSRVRPRESAVRTISGPTPFEYRYLFSTENGGTVVRLQATVELHGPAAFVPQLAKRAVRRGVDENLASLKAILEAGV